MTFARSLLGWLLLLVVAVANGMLRQVIFGRHFDEHRANQISCGLGIVLFAITMRGLHRIWPFRSLAQAWRTGLLWLAMTVAWEFLFFHYAAGHSWKELLDNYAFWEGRLWVLVLLWVACGPAILFVAARETCQRRIALLPALMCALGGWAVCGIVMVAGRAVLGLDVALWVHLAAVPLTFFVATVICWGEDRHPGALSTAALLLTVVLLMDLLVVAPLLERSFAMFGSIIGVWLPFGMIFAASLTAGGLLSRDPDRRHFLRWMPSRREQRMALPGDGCLDVRGSATHGISIDVPAARIWPRLLQAGSGFEVLEMAAERHLVLGRHVAVFPPRPLSFHDASPPVSMKTTRSFVLQPARSAGTRLLIRARWEAKPSWLWAPWNTFFFIAYIVRQRRQLLDFAKTANLRLPQ